MKFALSAIEEEAIDIRVVLSVERNGKGYDFRILEVWFLPVGKHILDLHRQD